jgi:DNA-directed RNA polymerase subunit M/transcription elongation factor TFIIS
MNHIPFAERKFRDKIINLFSKNLLICLDNIQDSTIYPYHTLDYTNQQLSYLIACEIDKGIINYMIKQRIYTFDKQVYKNRARLVKFNLLPNKSVYCIKYNKVHLETLGQFNFFTTRHDTCIFPPLLDRYFKKEITMKFICEDATHRDLYPERYEHVEYDIHSEMECKLYFDNYENRPDGAVQCWKCKSWKTEYNEKQLRSADEPTTKFAYCWKCKNRWRFS